MALRPLVIEDENEAENDDEKSCRRVKASFVARYQAKVMFCIGRLSELPIYTKICAPAFVAATPLTDKMRALMLTVAAYWVKYDPKHYVKIVVSFYQVSASFSSNIDVNWPDTVTSVWKFFSFLTMEIFKLYGYDCMFGGLNYLQRLIMITLLPLFVVFVFSWPWLASFFYNSQRRIRVFERFCNTGNIHCVCVRARMCVAFARVIRPWSAGLAGADGDVCLHAYVHVQPCGSSIWCTLCFAL